RALVAGAWIDDVVAVVAIVQAVEGAQFVVALDPLARVIRAGDRPPALERVIARLEVVPVPDTIDRGAWAAWDALRDVTTREVVPATNVVGPVSPDRHRAVNQRAAVGAAGAVGERIAVAVLGHPRGVGDVADPDRVGVVG